MANNRHQRRAQAAQSSKTRGTTQTDLLRQLLTGKASAMSNGMYGTGPSADPNADDDDEDTKDESGESMMDVSDGGDEGSDTDEQNSDGTPSADQIDAMLDQLLGIDDSDGMGDSDGTEPLKAIEPTDGEEYANEFGDGPVLDADEEYDTEQPENYGKTEVKNRKRAALAKKTAVARKLVQNLNSQLKNSGLDATTKRFLVRAAAREALMEASAKASKVEQKTKQAQRARQLTSRKSAELQQQLVEAIVEEKLMGYRPQGRMAQMGLVSLPTDTKSFGGRSQLSGNYRRGLPEFKVADIGRALHNPTFAAKFGNEIKALGGATQPGGGYLVPQEWAKEFLELLRAKAVVRKFARIYPMTEATFHLPSQTGATTAGFIGENSDISSTFTTDQVFSEIVFTAKNLAAFSKVSNQLLADSTYDAEDVVREDLRREMALAEDLNFLTAGTNSTTSPASIFGSIPAANNIVGQGTSQALIADDIFSLMDIVEAQNGQVDVFITNHTGLTKIRKLKDTTGNFIFSSAGGVNSPRPVVEAPHGEDPTNYGPVGYILERPVYITNKIASIVTVPATNGSAATLTGGSGALLFAGESRFAAIGQRAEIEIAASNVAGNSFQFNQTYFRAIMREDFKLTLPNTWAVLAFN